MASASIVYQPEEGATGVESAFSAVRVGSGDRGAEGVAANGEAKADAADAASADDAKAVDADPAAPQPAAGGNETDGEAKIDAPPPINTSKPASDGKADDPRWFEGMSLVQVHGMRTGVGGYEASTLFYHIPRALGVYFFAMTIVVGLMFGVSAGLRTIYGFVRTPAPPIKCDWSPMAGSELSAADVFRPFVISDSTADQGQPNTVGDDVASVLVIWLASLAILMSYGGLIASAWTLLLSALRGRELIELKRFDLAPFRKPGEEPGSDWWDVTVQVLYHGMVCTAPVLSVPIAYAVEGNLGDAVGVGVTVGLCSAGFLAVCHEVLMTARLGKLIFRAMSRLGIWGLQRSAIDYFCCCLACVPWCRARMGGQAAAAAEEDGALRHKSSTRLRLEASGAAFFQVASANIVTNYYFDDEQGGALTCRNRPAGRRESRAVLGRHNICFRINQVVNYALGWLGLRAPWFLFFSRFTLLLAVVFGGSFKSTVALTVLLPWIAALLGVVVVSCAGHALYHAGATAIASCCKNKPVSPAAPGGAHAVPDTPVTQNAKNCHRLCGRTAGAIGVVYARRNRIANAAGWGLLVLALFLSLGYEGGMDATLTQWGTFCTMMSALSLLYTFSETARRTLVEDKAETPSAAGNGDGDGDGAGTVTDRDSGSFRPSRYLDTFWTVWQGLAVVFVILFVYGAGWTEPPNTDAENVLPRGPVPVPVDNWTTSRPYGVCSERWGPSELDFDVVDAAHMARLAYSTNGNVTRDLSIAFGGRNATHVLPGEWSLVKPKAARVDKPAGLLGDNDDNGDGELDVRRSLSQYYIFNNDAHKFSVVAVRGTTVERDWIQNANVWGEVTLLQAFSFVFPMGFWPEKTIQALVDWEWLVASLQSWAVELPEMRYICEIRKGVGDALDSGAMHKDFVVVGHSLGGGLAKIVGTRLGAPSVSLSGPGLYQTRRKFGLTLEALSRLVTQVTPRFDIVPRVDWPEALTQHIACYNIAQDPNVVDCHSIASTVCELAHVCGDPLARNVKTNHAGPCFDTKVARTTRVTASGRFVPV